MKIIDNSRKKELVFYLPIRKRLFFPYISVASHNLLQGTDFHRKTKEVPRWGK